MITAKLTAEHSSFEAGVELVKGTTEASVEISGSSFNAFLNTSVRIPDHLEIEGDWNGVCVCGHPVSENIENMVFKCVYRNGSYSLCTPTPSPAVWGETEGEQTVVFSYEEGGVVITASKSASVYKPKPVGGILFYIDSTADGEYLFWDENNNMVDTPTVGTDCTGWTYMVEGATKDKFYVVHDELYAPNAVWTYYKDGAFVLEVVGASGAVIGTGKNNTAKVMSKDDGAYITANSNGKPTMWYLIQQMRTNLVGGCDDWYVPSWRELEAMINSGVVSWVRNWIWDSTENGANYGHCWTGAGWSLNSKGWHCRVCGIRSF